MDPHLPAAESSSRAFNKPCWITEFTNVVTCSTLLPTLLAMLETGMAEKVRDSRER
jgi:hypothetical protein